MCIRLRIARWLAPEVFRERDVNSELAAYRKDAMFQWMNAADKRSAALRRIVNRATPNANATVKAMVKIAQDGLNGGTQ